MTDEVRAAEAEAAAEQPYDANDPSQVNAARKKAARLLRERLDVVKALMDLKPGRLWMYDHLQQCHIFAPSFVPGDPHATSYKEGERNVGLRLLADIMQAAPDQYVTMVREAKERK